MDFLITPMRTGPTLDEVLQRDDVSLQEVLEHDELLAEAKSGNERLGLYLSRMQRGGITIAQSVSFCN